MGEVTVVAVIFSRPSLVSTRFAAISVVVVLNDSCRSTASGFCRPGLDVCRLDGDRPENWCLLTFPPVRSEPRPAEMNLHTGISACASPESRDFALRSLYAARELHAAVFRTHNGNTVQDCSPQRERDRIRNVLDTA